MKMRSWSRSGIFHRWPRRVQRLLRKEPLVKAVAELLQRLLESAEALLLHQCGEPLAALCAEDGRPIVLNHALASRSFNRVMVRRAPALSFSDASGECSMRSNTRECRKSMICCSLVPSTLLISAPSVGKLPRRYSVFTPLSAPPTPRI